MGLGAGRRIDAIQLPYHTGFPNIWEYAEAMKRGDVDFSVFVVGKCPLCGQRGCLREITPYSRGVMELFSWRTGDVLVARFLCRSSAKTVSLLPLELIPYCRYTLQSIVMTLLFFHAVWGTPGRTLEDIWDDLPPDSSVTVYLVRYWLCLVLRGFRRGHAELSQRYDLETIRTKIGLAGDLTELHGYFDAFGIRGPPEGCYAVAQLAASYSEATGRFLVGRSSQDRRSQG